MMTVLESTELADGLPAGPELHFGYNHNFRHNGRLFHVQTEDSGGPHGHIDSHVFFAGTVIASRKTEYHPSNRSRDELQRMMRRSHRAMCISLRDGDYDERIAALTSRPAAVRRRTNTELAAVRSDTVSGDDTAALPVPTPLRPPGAKDPIVQLPAVHKCLTSLEDGITGFLGAAVVNRSEGTVVRSAGSPSSTRLAVTGNAQLLQAKLRMLEQLDLAGSLEDILISLDDWFCILRPLDGDLFLSVVLDRTRGNLAMARRVVSAAAAELLA